MKNIGKLVLLGAVAAASAHFASAATITGTVGVTDFTATDAGSTPTSFVLSSATGITFAAGGTPTLSNYTVSPVVYTFTALGGAITSSGPHAGGTAGELFSSLDSTADTLQFVGQTYSAFLLNTGNGDYSFTVNGYFTGSNITGQVAGVDNFVFDPTAGTATENLGVSPAPEPNSLMLLGTGLLSGAGMLIRKRRTA